MKTHRENFNHLNNKTDGQGAWASGHLEALAEAQEEATVGLPPNSVEAAYAQLLLAWLDYADAHQREHASPIGEDGFLGPVWAMMGDTLRKLLNGPLGRLDAATLNRSINASLAQAGVGERQFCCGGR